MIEHLSEAMNTPREVVQKINEIIDILNNMDETEDIQEQLKEIN
jgi:division protein CdvB (Snf7/Vps24/ESCRT-III family)